MTVNVEIEIAVYVVRGGAACELFGTRLIVDVKVRSETRYDVNVEAWALRVSVKVETDPAVVTVRVCSGPAEVIVSVSVIVCPGPGIVSVNVCPS